VFAAPARQLENAKLYGTAVWFSAFCFVVKAYFGLTHDISAASGKPVRRRIYTAPSPLAASKEREKLVDTIWVSVLNYLSKDEEWGFQVILKRKETL